MVTTNDAADAVEFLLKSDNRLELLAALREADALEWQTLREECSATRTTLRRNLDAMTDRGWVRGQNGSYQVTVLGDLVGEEVAAVLETLDGVADLAPFLERVPATHFDLDPRALANATVTHARPESPFAPVDRVVSLRRQSESIREVSSIVALDSAEQMEEQAMESGPDATNEVVLQADVIEAILDNPDYRDQFERTASADTVDVYRYEDRVPFLLGLLDDVVVLGATDDDGNPNVLVESDAPAVREWAEKVYREYRAAATPYEG